MPDEESLTPKDYALLDSIKRENLKFSLKLGIIEGLEMNLKLMRAGLIEKLNREATLDEKEKITGQPETSLFTKDEEKYLFEKINEIRKYFSTTKKQESYEETLKILAEAKPTTDNFFDNVIVNDENIDIKKNRLELLQMFCRTFNNFIDFSKVEGA